MKTEDTRLAELETRFHEDGISYLLIQFVDIHGAAKVKLVPATTWRSVAEAGAGFAGGAVGGWGRGLTHTTCSPDRIRGATPRSLTSPEWRGSPRICTSMASPTPIAPA